LLTLAGGAAQAGTAPRMDPQDHPAPVFFLLALGPRPRVTPGIKPLHMRRGCRVCTCPQAPTDPSKRGTASAGACSGGWRPPSPLTAGTGSFRAQPSPLPFAEPAAPVPCSAELSCCLAGVVLISNAEPRHLWKTASCPFPVCPRRLATADAFQGSSAFTAAGKRENGWLCAVGCLCARRLWLQPLAPSEL